MTEKLTDEQLWEKMDKAPKPGDEFVHYKNGHYYRVVNCSINEATQEVMVTYIRSNGSIPPFCRPLSEFREPVEIESGPNYKQFVPRFKPVPVVRKD